MNKLINHYLIDADSNGRMNIPCGQGKYVTAIPSLVECKKCLEWMKSQRNPALKGE